MGFVNTVSKGVRETSHRNWMDGTSWDVSNPLQCLRMAASSCFFGEPMYYHRDEDDEEHRGIKGGQSPSKLDGDELRYVRELLNSKDPQEWRALTPALLMEKAIDAALDHSIEETLQVAVALRNEDFIRVTPQVILVRAANHPKSKLPQKTPKGSVSQPNPILKYAAQIIQRPDEPATGLAYQVEKYGKNAPIPNVLKKAWATALARFKPQTLAKYRMENRVYKTRDVAKLSHPSGPHFKELYQGTLSLQEDTWESLISAKGSTTETWTQAVALMGHMALLRNLRNLSEKKVPPSVWKEKLISTAKDGKQLPFRYFSAYRALEQAKASPEVLDAVEQSLFESMVMLPSFKGRAMSLCDNSGSATGAATSNLGTMSIASIANLTGILTAQLADEGHVGIFGDDLSIFPVRKRSSVFDMLQKADSLGRGIGGGTENGIWLFFDRAIRNREHWDHIFVYSDMQAGHGGLYGRDVSSYKDFLFPGKENRIDVAKLISTYRARVNPKVLVFLVQMAGYQDTVVPEFYERTFILGGWSSGVIQFAGKMAKQYSSPVPAQQ